MCEFGKDKRGIDDTARQKAKRASARHLNDLRNAHGRPPADVALASVAIPQRISGVQTASWCGSPAQMCAELAQ